MHKEIKDLIILIHIKYKVLKNLQKLYQITNKIKTNLSY